MRVIPDLLRASLRTRLWAAADAMNWARLSLVQKTSQYEIWAADPTVGGVLGDYLDQRRVRVYIKDTVMKGYGRRRLADTAQIMRVLGLSEHSACTTEFQRPHGRRLCDGRVVTWGNAVDWKDILMATHERVFMTAGTKPGAAILLDSGGKFAEVMFRELVEDAATKLGLPCVVWLE